jgi:hypothetical protein
MGVPFALRTCPVRRVRPHENDQRKKFHEYQANDRQFDLRVRTTKFVDAI